MTGPKVRFIVHEGRRSGPPIYALHVLRWLAAHTDLDLGVVLSTGGPLEPEFAAICPTRDHATDPEGGLALLEEADVAYVNTAISIRLLRETGYRPPIVLTHIHELEIGLRYWLAPEDRRLILEVTDRFLVGPRCAVDNLVSNHGVPRAKIGQVAYFVPPGASTPSGAAPRRELGIGDDTVLVGMCGAREWRKAPDLFSHLAWHSGRLAPELDLRFLWVGSPIPTGPHWDEAGELDLLHLGERLTFVEDQSDPDPWLAALDVYALTSREDNFPLACLTACSFGVPAVTFDGGGIAELVEASGGGRVVAYPEVEHMAAEIVGLARDRARRRRLGERARRYVAARHGLDRCARQVADEISALVRP